MKKRKRSIRFKVTMSLIMLALLLGSLLMTVSYITYKDSMNRQFEETGMRIARTAIMMLDDAQIRSLVDQLETEDPDRVMAGEEYRQAVQLLRSLGEASHVLYLYLYYPAENGVYFILDTDESEEACPYGSFMTYGELGFPEIPEEVQDEKTVNSAVADKESGWAINV